MGRLFHAFVTADAAPDTVELATPAAVNTADETDCGENRVEWVREHLRWLETSL